MWFDNWFQLVRVGLVGLGAYVALIVILRVSGQRTLAKLNAFDLVITVALGSTLATVMLNPQVAWVEGVVALGTLVLLQFVVAATSSRIPGARSLLTAEPALLLDRGQLLDDELRRHRVVAEEVRQAVRAAGSGALADVEAVVLETDGSISVITRAHAGDLSALGLLVSDR